MRLALTRKSYLVALVLFVAVLQAKSPAAAQWYDDCENLGFCQAQFDRCWSQSYSQFATCVGSCPLPIGAIGIALRAACMVQCEGEWAIRNLACLNRLAQCNECRDRPDLPDPTDCPVLIDLDRNNFHLTGLDDGVLFDINADGESDTISWTLPGHRDAFLCLDRNDNGLIDNGAELFGNSTPLLLHSGFLAPHGYIALAEFDTYSLGGSHDSFIDRNDAIYEDLCVWTDSNHNGMSESEEISSLNAAGVERIGLTYRSSRRTDQHGNEFRYSSDAWVRVNGASKYTRTIDVFLVGPWD
jgi:hypothetical protein